MLWITTNVLGENLLAYVGPAWGFFQNRLNRHELTDVFQHRDTGSKPLHALPAWPPKKGPIVLQSVVATWATGDDVVFIGAFLRLLMITWKASWT